MMTYEIAPCTKRCARTGRELRPGERYMAALYQRHGQLVREDVSLEAWEQPAAEAFAWWQTKVPEGGPARPVMIDEGLVYDCFLRLEGETEPRKVLHRVLDPHLDEEAIGKVQEEVEQMLRAE
jgi:hypothetical protein